jgi:hypothetical protein
MPLIGFLSRKGKLATLHFLTLGIFLLIVFIYQSFNSIEAFTEKHSGSIENQSDLELDQLRFIY